MISSLSSLDNNFADGIHKVNINIDIMIKNVKLTGLNINIVCTVLNI